MSRVPSKPRRRTYKTGGNLPALTDEYRPIPLGRDSQGDFDEQIRALAVLVKNRSDSSIFIKEGPDTDDAHEIARGEDYRIWEPNGVSSLSMRGENGDEVAEVRTLEAHNDFSFADRIEAFTRSLSHFMSTATSNTTISGQDVDISIDDAGGLNVSEVDANITNSSLTVDSVTGGIDANVSGNVDIGQFTDTVTIDNIQTGSVDANVTNGSLTVDSVTGGLDVNASGTVDIGQFTDTVTVDDITGGTVNVGSINGQNLNLDANGNLVVGNIQAGNIDANVTGNVTVDDITAGSVGIDGSVTIDSVNTGTLDANITNADIPVSGSVGITGGTITIDDITGASVSFDGDITGQNDFDLQVKNRLGQKTLRTLRDTTGQTGQDNTWTLLDPAPNDGAIEYVNLRIYFSSVDVSKIGGQLEIDRGNTGSWERVSPRAFKAGLSAVRYSSESNSDVSVSKMDVANEVIMEYRPQAPVVFQEGDSIRLNVTDAGEWAVASGNSFNCEAEISFKEVVKQ